MTNLEHFCKVWFKNLTRVFLKKYVKLMFNSLHYITDLIAHFDRITIQNISDDSRIPCMKSMQFFLI